MSDQVGKYDFQKFKRGDTFAGRNIATLTDSNGDPVAVSRALMQLRTRGRGATRGTLIHEWTTEGTDPNATISGDGDNIIAIDDVHEATTAEWPIAELVYDLEVTFTSGNRTRTILEGILPVHADVSHSA